MKMKLSALMLVLVMLFSVSASALSPADFENGSLSGITKHENGLLVTDTYNKVIWHLNLGKVTCYAGAINVADISGEPIGRCIDGASDKAYFMEPWDIAPFLDGYAVSDTAAHVIRFVGKDHVVTAAGQKERSGKSDGNGTGASFNRPTGLAADDKGNLYIADTGNGSIRMMDKNGKVTTVLSGLVEPTGLCWADGMLYIAETGRSRICRMNGTKLEVIAGDTAVLEDGEYIGGFANGPVSKAKFDHPQDLVVNKDGSIFVSDTGNSCIRKIADGRVTTFVAASSTTEPPIQPRGLLRANDTLIAADQFARTLLYADAAPLNFFDIPADPALAKMVIAGTERGITNGYSDHTFRPHSPITRATFSVMLSRLHAGKDGEALIEGSATFSDVAADAWYGSAARWACENKIVLGNDGKFLAQQGISHQQLIAMLYRYAEGQGLDVSQRASLAAYSDAASLSDYAVEPMQWAVAMGIIGANTTSLEIWKTTTRLEAMSYLVTFMDAYQI